MHSCSRLTLRPWGNSHLCGTLQVQIHLAGALSGVWGQSHGPINKLGAEMILLAYPFGQPVQHEILLNRCSSQQRRLAISSVRVLVGVVPKRKGQASDLRSPRRTLPRCCYNLLCLLLSSKEALDTVLPCGNLHWRFLAPAKLLHLFCPDPSNARRIWQSKARWSLATQQATVVQQGCLDRCKTLSSRETLALIAP